jgi:hypothetical protein
MYPNMIVYSPLNEIALRKHFIYCAQLGLNHPYCNSLHPRGRGQIIGLAKKPYEKK